MSTALIRSNTQLLDYMKNNGTPEFVFFWGHTADDITNTNKSCFSQWFPSPFTHNGQQYLSAEHWMMAEKARYFGDTDTEQKIMEATLPSYAKKLGRTVKGFSDAEWDKVKVGTVFLGNVHKFQQHLNLKEFLLSTGDAVLVEASPYDKVWGIGMDEHHPTVNDPYTWRGENLLGYCLMAVREYLRVGEHV